MCYILAKTVPLWSYCILLGAFIFVMLQNARDQWSDWVATTLVVSNTELFGVATPFLVAFALYLIFLNPSALRSGGFGAGKAQ